MDTIALALHVTAVAVLVGPQLLMLAAVVPASWLIEDDERLKRALLRAVAARFGLLAVIAIVTLIVTGTYQYQSIVPSDIRDQSRFTILFGVKMTMFSILLVMIGAHAWLFSRRIARLSDAVIAGDGDVRELERVRRQSFMFSIVTFIVSVVVLWLGVALGHHEFSWQ